MVILKYRLFVQHILMKLTYQIGTKIQVLVPFEGTRRYYATTAVLHVQLYAEYADLTQMDPGSRIQIYLDFLKVSLLNLQTSRYYSCVHRGTCTMYRPGTKLESKNS